MPLQPYADRIRSCRLLCLTLLLGLAIAIPSEPASADSSDRARPFWTEQAMYRFGEDLFFIGQASCAASAEEGRQQAYANGVQELLNYARARSAAGVVIETQMIHEERPAAGCAQDRTTVWRLLRVNAAQAAALARRAAETHREDHGAPIKGIVGTRPLIGLSREEVFSRLGRPSSVTLRRTEFSWEYRQYGMIIEFDRHLFVRNWRRMAAAEQGLPSPEPNDVPR